MTIHLLSEAQARDHEISINEILLRQVAEDLIAQGWERDEFDRFLRELMEE